MSTSTYFEFRNINDPKYIAAISDPESLKEWEEYNGLISNRPGTLIGEYNDRTIVQETDDEYGGWIIPIADIPKETTHIIVSRG